MTSVPATLQTLSVEKQKFFIFLTRYCGFTFRMRFKRGTRWVLRFTYPDDYDTNIIYEVRQDDFTPVKQWLRIIQTSDEVARPLYDHFCDIYNNHVETFLCSPHS